MFNNIIQRLLAVAVLSGTVIGSQMLERKSFENYLTSTSKEEAKLADNTLSSRLRVARLSPSFGFDNTVANSIFVQFLQYFGDDAARAQTGYQKSPDFFEAIINHDPSYRNFYIFLSGSSTLYAGNPEKSTALMETGLGMLKPNQPSDSYFIWRYKGVDELLFLGDSKAARASFLSASEWAEQSQDKDSDRVGKLSRRTSEFLADNPDSRTAQIDAWSSLLGTALDNNTRKRAVEKIEKLGGSVAISESGGISIQYEKAENADKALDNPDI